MKRMLSIFALATVMHAQQLSDAKPPVSITVTVCKPYIEIDECHNKLMQWQRAHDIAALVPLLIEDFKDIGGGTVDKALRNRIAAITERLAKNKYD